MKTSENQWWKIRCINSLTVYGEPVKVEETFKYPLNILVTPLTPREIMSPFVNIELTNQWDP